MSEFAFEPATKDQAKARIALAGPSGSGKTWTSLTVAQALGEKVAVIDTERGSASKYASDFKFDRLNMNRYDPRDLAKALAAAAQAGYEVVIVDSLSKFWSGSGGMLEQVDNAAKRGYGGNSFGGWKEARPMESAMVEALLSYPGHVIVTMRTKTAYEIIEDERGRKVPTKLGLKPEQRDGIEYEFDIVGDMDLQNALTVSKSRCRSLSGMVIQRPDATLGEEILAWLSDGKPAMNATDYREAACAPGATTEMLRTLHAEVKAKGLLGAAVALGDETLTLGALIVRKGQEATQRERSGSTESPAGPAKPAATRRPRVVKDAAALDPESPWAARVEEITCDADALAIGAEVDAEASDGSLSEDKATAVRSAIVARLDALKHEAAA
jgi:energy-coupling factor transporter ATP-binding protein EcfA2